MNQIQVSDIVLQSAMDHLYSDAIREVGGFFIGDLEDNQAVITASIPALAATGSEVNLTFGHEVWTEVMNEVDNKYPGSKIVGWFHSHPGHGVFLSGYDQFIQLNFFPADGMLALVLDPHSNEFGWFETRDGEIKELERSMAVRPEGAAKTVEVAAERRSKIATYALLASLFVLASFIGGYLLGSGGSDDAVVGVDPQSQVESFSQRALEAEGKLADIEKYLIASKPQISPENNYVISPNDSLWNLAVSKLGDGMRWREIYELNRASIGDLDPNGGLPKSSIGITIVIPAN